MRNSQGLLELVQKLTEIGVALSAEKDEGNFSSSSCAARAKLLALMAARCTGVLIQIRSSLRLCLPSPWVSTSVEPVAKR